MESELLQEKITTERLRQQILYERARPAYLHRSYLYMEGDKWVCVGGLEDEKVAREVFDDEVTCRIYGYGNSPKEALDDFDRAWTTGEFEVTL